jgi:hypothetical protein
MAKKFKYFVYALQNVFDNDDYLCCITNGKMTGNFVGEYQGLLNDKKICRMMCAVFIPTLIKQ